MGSLRNPIGPLPSSIYWRRRAVLLSILALLALLVVWIIGPGGGSKNNSGGSNGKNPAPSITPGPSGSGPAISQAPGGRDESSGGSSDGTGGSPGASGGPEGGSGGGPGGSADSAGSSGSSGSSGTSGSSGSSGSSGGGSGGGTGGGAGGEQVPAGSGLPDCTARAVQLALRGERNSYAPGQKPVFELTAKNVSGSDCKIGLGAKQAVVTITEAGDDKTVWASDDCPKSGSSLYLRVPADGTITHTVTWDRKPSAPECATPSTGAVTADTYLVEAKIPGFSKLQTSFVLAKD